MTRDVAIKDFRDKQAIIRKRGSSIDGYQANRYSIRLFHSDQLYLQRLAQRLRDRGINPRDL